MLTEVINLASKFDAKGFKQAETSAQKLNRTVKNLGRTLGLSLSAAAITAYGKAAVKAAADDAKAQAILAKQLENVGQAYAVTQVEAYIASQEKLTGILDDSLRPAFGKLVTVTGSATQSQYLLQVALDASAGSGMDLLSTSQALAQAYQGNYKGLKQLNLGLTTAQLKAASFSDILARINDIYKGQGKVAADSYAGSLQKINTAAKNAQETIGYGLIDAFKALGDNDSVDQATTDLQHFADTVADAIRGVGVLAGSLNKLTGTTTAQVPGWLEALSFMGVGGALANIVGAKSKPQGVSGGASDRYWMNQQKKANQLQKEKNLLLGIDNANTKEKLKMTAGEKALAELKRIFDIRGIELQAALNGATDDETRKRIEALKAINSADEAMALMALNAYKAANATEELAGTMSAAMKALMNPMVMANTGSVISGNQNGVWSNADVQYLADVTRSNALNRLDAIEAARASTYAAQGGVVNISINPAVSGLIDVIQNSSASGVSPTVNRNASSYIA